MKKGQFSSLLKSLQSVAFLLLESDFEYFKLL